MGWELANLSIKCVGICVAESSVCNLDSHFTSLRWIHLNILNNKRLLGLPCNGSCKSWMQLTQCYQESISDWQCGYNMDISHCKAITRVFTERNCNTKLWQSHFLFVFAELKYHGILVIIPFQLIAMKPKKIISSTDSGCRFSWIPT